MESKERGKRGRAQGVKGQNRQRLVGESERKLKRKGTSKHERMWDQTEDYTSMPLLSMRCGEKQPETESPDQWQVLVKRVKSTCVKTRAGNGQFVCNTKFEASAEQDQDDKTGQKESEPRLRQ